MKDTRLVSHEGIVVNAKGNRIQVKIISTSACGGCHARGACTASDKQERIISATPLGFLKEGDTAIVKMEEKMGWIALFYGFFLPFLILVAILFTLPALGFSETFAGLMAVGSLVPYYVVLYIFKKKIEKDFVFTAEKINTI